MASSRYNSSLIMFIALAIVLLFVDPVFSAPRRALRPHKRHKIGLKVMLQRVDSGKNLTKFERIRHGINRGKNRLQRFNAAILAAASPDAKVEAPVNSGNGEYLMKLAIGTPPLPFSAVLDTGSDLIWTQCQPCVQCYKQPSPIFDPQKSSTFSQLPCSSPLCSALPSSTCGDGCEYVYTYGDYSVTQGVMATETFTFDKVSVPNVGFGCGEDNEGNGFEQGAGLVGLGRGALSLVSQLKEPKFSYCLTSIEESKASTLLMGSSANLKGKKQVKTPLVKNPQQPSFYYLSLEGISVGGTRLPIDKSTFEVQRDGSGGMIIDSGTTITYLEESAFEALKQEFISQTNLPIDKSGAAGLDVCFSLPSDPAQVQVPKLVFHFKGGDLELPVNNYMIGDSDIGVLCLAMGASSGMSIFGNVQQQNILVLHDLAKETIAFAPAQCDRL